MNALEQQGLNQALGKCAIEPIHQIGSIQSHGALLVCNDDKQRSVLQASENVATFLGLAHDRVIGNTLSELLGADAIQPLEQLLAQARLKQTATGLITIYINSNITLLEAHVYLDAGFWVLELSHDNGLHREFILSGLLLKMQRGLLEHGDNTPAIPYFNQLAILVRELTGFESVMVYRFDDNWDGEVICQCKNDSAPSFLGMHFPASDIPPQARHLYTNNLVRIVEDIEALPVAIIPALNPVSGQPLDMTHSALRNLAPVHIKYLQNIGVRATLVISLMENDQLWGLIACHHQSARHTTLAIREAAIFISRMASTKLNSLAALEHGNLIGQALLINGEILKYIPVENEGALLRRLLPKLRQLLHASGIIMVVQGRRYDQGEVPPAETLDGLLTWLSTQPVSETFSCDFLAKLYPPAAAFQEIASGLIATSLSGDMKNCIVWLRGEKARNIHWAGKYTEGLKQDAAGSYYLTPRSSFEALTELWRGHCEPWSPAEIGIVLLLANSLSEGLLQKSLREMELNQQKIANAELLMALEASRNEDQVMVQKLSLAVEQSSASIVITDLAAKIEYVNNAFLKISGFTREEVLGRNPNFLQSGKTPKATYQTLWSTLTRGETWVGELINRRKDGSEFVESALISPVRQTDGSITHYLAIKENITEHKRHAKQLEEAKEKAEMANRAKSAFLANMSHEIRTPMNGVIGLSELALESFDAVEKQGYLRQILESSKSLMGILNDILDLSKIEAQQVTIEYNVFNLAEMLDGLKQMFSLRAHEKSLEFMLVCAPEIPNFLIGDELRLRQILTNLLSNSLKFTERGHITLNVCQIAGQDNASTIRFSVMDSGIGMTFEQIGKLFQPFAQADNSITRRFGGTGLGLTISRNLAQLMGGDIQVESTEGAGSKFHLQVKLDKADAGEIERLNTQHQADLMQPNSYTATRVLRGKEVLLAEDNTVNQLVASKMLTKHGLRVDIANNGEEALRCLDRKYYDVVLMDIQMPVMDGLEATRLIRENPRFSDLPIVAMSAGVTLDEQEMCNQAGMTAFIGKPIDSNELIKKLIELLTFGNATEPNEQAAASSADKFNLSGFDNQRLAELTELFGETDSVIELISDFRNDFIGTTELIKDMLNRGDLISACKKAHSIKGSSSNLGAVEISAAASDLEEKLKLGEEASLELKRLTQAWELFMSQTIATV